MMTAQCESRVTGTSAAGGWYYAACSCGWKEGNNAHQSASEADEAWVKKHRDKPALD